MRLFSLALMNSSFMITSTLSFLGFDLWNDSEMESANLLVDLGTEWALTTVTRPPPDRIPRMSSMEFEAGMKFTSSIFLCKTNVTAQIIKDRGISMELGNVCL